MRFFNDLVEEYLLPEPKGFAYYAARRKAGASPLEIRAELMDMTGASRLAAGKLVGEAEKAIKIAKINMVSGIGLLLLGILLLLTGDWRGVFALIVGPAQFAAGRRVWHIYQKAERAEAMTAGV